MKGIVLAGGSGSRLWPVTKVTSKQLLPVFDKPMIYYPISTLMLAGIQEILIITTPHDLENFQNLLGDGSNFGVNFTFAVQPKPEGLAQAFIIGEEFLGQESCMMILGDNIFYGAGLGQQLQQTLPSVGAHIFTYEVSNPSQYGILTLDEKGNPSKIEEKPMSSSSNLAVTGLYFFDNNVCEIAKKVQQSLRGELEITEIIDTYLKKGTLEITKLSRGTAWLDTGTPEALHDAATFIRVIEERTGLKIACLEEIALNNGWVNKNSIIQTSKTKNYYGKYIERILNS
jgi:glucose-1-phosphate thymidylyltransferase